jgi:hypothetical protein
MREAVSVAIIGIFDADKGEAAAWIEIRATAFCSDLRDSSSSLLPRVLEYR